MIPKITQLRRYIISHGSITKMIAARLFNVYGLKEQLNRLKFSQHEIITVMVERPNRQAYARYTLVNK